ncbi:MAG TPA: acyl-CoA dehydrogenase family protein [Burkholderiales bacterium]|nr:acyl-CoA dehydrogenase family protein [Burkholderiales bacterium]
MYDLRLTAEQLEFRDTVRDFVNQEVKPVVLHPERLQNPERRMSLELLDKASQMGLRALTLSEEAGGAGAGALTASIVLEELGAGDVDVAMTIAETAQLAHLLFDRVATAAQRERFLPGFLDDDRCHLAVAGASHDSERGWNYHRPSEGSIPRAVEAVRVGDGAWTLNGIARFVLNAPIAKLILVEARSAGGTSAFLIEAGTAGLTVRDHRDAPLDGTAPQLQWYHGTRGEIVLERCKLSAGQLLGEEGRSPLAGEGGRAAPLPQAINLGIGRAAMEAAIDYAGLRIQGARRIIEHQAIGTILADIAIQLEAARSLVWRAAFSAEHPEASAGLSDLPLQHVAKIFTSQAVHEATERAAECFGAMGVMKDMPLHRYVHDAVIFLHSVSGNSVAKFRVAEALAGYRREASPESVGA